MQGLTVRQVAIKIVSSFYEETTIDASISDTIDTANKKIVDDFEYAKRLALKCVEFLELEHTYKQPIAWNGSRLKFHGMVKNCIKSLTMQDILC